MHSMPDLKNTVILILCDWYWLLIVCMLVVTLSLHMMNLLYWCCLNLSQALKLHSFISKS